MQHWGRTIAVSRRVPLRAGMSTTRMRVAAAAPAAGYFERPTPLLFVHGAWNDSACWQDYLSFFASRGFTAGAVELTTANAEASILGAAEKHVLEAANSLPCPNPIIIGEFSLSLVPLVTEAVCCGHLLQVTGLVGMCCNDTWNQTQPQA
jgi:hypothetical protein